MHFIGTHIEGLFQNFKPEFLLKGTKITVLHNT